MRTNRHRVYLLVVLWLTACQMPYPTLAPAQPALLATSVSQPALRIAAYYPSWTSVSARDLPAERLTQINYAFALPTEDADCHFDTPAAAERNLPALRQLRKDHPGLELILSIAGYGYDKQYKAIVETPQNMQKFAAACIQLMKAQAFDGIDLDWEYPKIDQKGVFTALLSEFRHQLDALGQADDRRYRLTIAAPAGSQIKAYDLPAITPLLDWFNVMTYDYYGTWLPITGFNAPLYVTGDDPQKLSADVTLSAYLAGGVPPEKLLLGIPFYGRGWTGARDQHDGLFQPYQGPLGKGTFEYREIEEKYIGQIARLWDNQAKVPWLYEPGSGNMITYDDPESVGLKAAYARQRGLGGVMIWQIAGDNRQSALLQAIYTHLIP